MGLNKVKPNSNMYQFITHTWNILKGRCSHDCSYCYMKRWGPLKPVRFDENELKTDLGTGNFIFIGSSNDMFAANISNRKIQKIIDYCESFDNRYLIQTKNPARFHEFTFSKKFTLGTTIETNRHYDCMGSTPWSIERAAEIGSIKDNETFVTIEPVIDFDLPEMLKLISIANPMWVNIGADSMGSGLPEPSREKLEELISGISSEVVIKKNMKRIRGSL